MLMKLSNFPDGSEVIAQMDENQVDFLEWLKEKGVLLPDFSFEEVSVKYLC